MKQFLLLSVTTVWLIAAFFPGSTATAQTAPPAVLSGTVADPTGAVIPRAEVHLSGSGLNEDGQSDNMGRFRFTVPPGTYTVAITFPDFSAYTSDPLTLKPNAQVRLPVRLTVAGRAEQISVGMSAGGSTDPNDNASALVFEGGRLNLLSDDNATLQQQLNALAGPSLGGGTQILVNGFSGGRLPPKSSIRSIRINANPYSAYFDSLGFGRVEVQTKPGADKLHGALNFAGTDQPFNAPNPYVDAVIPPYYQFQTDGNLNGPINRKTSYFLAGNVQQLANNAVVNAVDPANPSATISQALPAPQHTGTFSLRVDRQFSPGNFAYARDEWSQTHITNSGISPLVLPAAAFASNTLTNTIQLSDTQIVSPHAVNESRFQYVRTRIRQDPNSTAPSVIVQGSFQDGGNPAQSLRDNQDQYELQDLLEFDHGRHSIRAGFRFRDLRESNFSNANFNGQYIFASLAGYEAAQAALPNPNGVPGAAQFNLTVGQPNAALWNADFGVFAEDDWKATKNLTFSYGLRLEGQSGVPNTFNPAPRLGLAWAVHRGKAAAPFVTFRTGYGLFYDRFPAANLLQAARQNGTSEIAYFVQNPGFYPNIPPPNQLPATQPTIYRVDPQLRSSYAQAGSVGIDRAIGKMGMVSSTFLFAHGTHGYLSRNANAPLPGTYNPADPNSGVRPLGTDQNIYQYSSVSNTNAELWFTNASLQVTKNLFVFGFYVLERNYDEGNSSTSFPANQYNIAAEYARSTNNHLNTLFTSVIWSLPHGFQLQPFLNVHSGAPFNITTGTELNGDTIFNDRPAFATDLSRASVVRTPFGNFDTSPMAGQPLIPRNYGNSPAFLWLDMQASKGFHIGPRPPEKPVAAAKDGKPAFPAARPDRPWELRFQVEAQNVLNHNNPGVPIGVLPYPGQPLCSGVSAAGGCSFFGHSLSLANDFSPLTSSNRTILLQSFFTF